MTDGPVDKVDSWLWTLAEELAYFVLMLSALVVWSVAWPINAICSSPRPVTGSIRVFNWCFGRDLPEPRPEAVAGISEILMCLLIVVGHLTAFGVYLQGKQTFSPWTWGSTPFVLIATVMLGSMVGIIRSTGACEDSPPFKRVYDSGTLRFGRYALVFSALMYVLVPTLAVFGKLPGMAPAALSPSTFSEYEFTEISKNNGIRVRIPITPEDFGGVYPHQAHLVVVLHQDVHLDWMMVGFDLLRADDSRVQSGLQHIGTNPDALVETKPDAINRFHEVRVEFDKNQSVHYLIFKLAPRNDAVAAEDFIDYRAQAKAKGHGEPVLAAPMWLSTRSKDGS